MKVIDTSSYNGKVNWANAKKQGLDAAIVKIIRKDLTLDNQFLSSQKELERVGIPYAVYNYSYATTVQKAKNDMHLICDILDKLENKKYFDGTIWFDLEDNCQAKLSKKKNAEILNTAQKIVEDRKYNFGVYTGLAYYKAHIDRKLVKCNNWWIARYYKGNTIMRFSDTPNATYRPKVDGLHGWQYTSSGIFTPAISLGNACRVDCNLMYNEITETEVEKIAREVISGKWGSGDVRKKKLQEAGYNYYLIQKKVNQIYKK